MTSTRLSFIHRLTRILQNVNAIADGTMHKAGPNEYLTNIIGNASLAWLDGALSNSQPFLAYIAPHGEGGGSGRYQGSALP